MDYHKQLVRALELLLQQGNVTDAGGLDVDITDFNFWRREDSGITLVTAAGSTGNTLTDDDVNYIFVDEASATITISLTAPVADQFPLAEVTTAAGDIVSINDQRSFFGLPWNMDTVELLAKGDLLGHDGSDETILNIGADGAVLTANSAEPTGLEWVFPAAPGPHATTHISGGGDTIPLADNTNSGLLDIISTNADEFLNGQHAWVVPPTVTDTDPGYVPAHPNDAGLAFLGDGTFGLPDRPIFMATSAASPGGGLLTWTEVINDPAASFTVDGVTTEISFPSNGTYNVDWKLQQLDTVTTAVRLQFNGSIVDYSSTTENGTDTLSGFSTVVVTDFTTDVLLLDVPTGGVGFSVPQRNRIRITKYK